MASQIYSRYVPPPRKKDIVKQELRVESLAQTSTPPSTNATPPATRPDASSTYARYIPPLKPKPQTSETSQFVVDKEFSPASKRKREDVDAAFEKRPRPKTKKSKKNTSTTDETIETQSEDIDQPQSLKKKSKATTQDHDIKESYLAKERKSKHGSRAETRTDENTEEPQSSQHAKKSKSKSKSKSNDVAPISNPTEVAANEEDIKHKKLMKKREKSLKKAEKLAEIAPDGKDQDGDHIMEDPVELHDLVPLPQPEPVLELPPVSILDSLPSWLASPIKVSQTSTAEFGELGLQEEVVKTLKARGFEKAFAVQAAVLPLLLPEATRQTGDVVVSAATGSGKTLAYVLPMIKDIHRFQVSKLRGLIVLPTRELVAQAKEVAEICASAFATDQKRVKIGTAVGSDTLKIEQASLIEHQYVYDPEAYEESVKEANKQWETVEDIDGGIEALLEEKPVAKLPDHVERLKMKVNVLICTPGRLVEHIKSTPGFTLEYVRWLVVDEADKLLDQSYQQWLNLVMASIEAKKDISLPKDNHLRKVILSATMTRDLGQLNELKLYRPKLVVLESSTKSTEAIQSYVLPSLLMESAVKVEEDGIKPLYLMELLRRQSIVAKKSEKFEEPDDNSTSESDSSSESDDSDSDSSEDSTEGLLSHEDSTNISEPKISLDSSDPRGVLIFTRSNEAAVRLGRLIEILAPPSSSEIGVLTSTLPRSSRQRTLQSFGKGRVSILVASDLVSRGLDLPNLAHVINYDVPGSLTSYIHRIGRTARAGRVGHAWTLFTRSEGRWFWNEIGRSELVQRSRGKIERVNIKTEIFDTQERAMYEKALEELGKEATGAALQKD